MHVDNVLSVQFQRERALVLVDGANLRGTLRELGYDGIDIDAFRSWLAAYGSPTVEWFQGAYPTTERFFNRLRASGVRVHAKIPKTLPTGQQKADMDVELALAAADADPSYRTVVLVSGDGDFEPVVRRLTGEGRRVVLLASWTSLASELVQHVELDDVVRLESALSVFGSVRRVS